MRTLITRTALALAAATCLAGSAWAGDKYILVSAGTTTYNGSAQSDSDAQLSAAGLSGVQSTMDTTTTGYKLFLGYKFSPNFAVEGGLVDLGSLNYNATFTGGSLSLTNKTSGFNLSALGLLPVNEDLSVFGKTGLTLASVKGSGTTSTGVSVSNNSDKSSVGYGVGLIYKINDTVGLRTEWERISTDMNLFSLGLQFNY